MCHNLVPVRSQLGRLCAILILTMSHCSNWLTQLIAPSHNSCPRRFATFQLNLFVFTINLCCTASRRVGWYVAGMPCQYIKIETWDMDEKTCDCEDDSRIYIFFVNCLLLMFIHPHCWLKASLCERRNFPCSFLSRFSAFLAVTFCWRHKWKLKFVVDSCVL